MRFSWTVISGNSRRPSGQMATPAPTMPGGDMRSRRRSPKRTSPEGSVPPGGPPPLPYETGRSRTSSLGILVHPQVGRHHGRVVADALGRSLGDLLAVVHDHDLPAALHDEAHVVRL